MVCTFLWRIRFPFVFVPCFYMFGLHVSYQAGFFYRYSSSVGVVIIVSLCCKSSRIGEITIRVSMEKNEEK